MMSSAYLKRCVLSCCLRSVLDRTRNLSTKCRSWVGDSATPLMRDVTGARSTGNHHRKLQEQISAPVSNVFHTVLWKKMLSEVQKSSGVSYTKLDHIRKFHCASSQQKKSTTGNKVIDVGISDEADLSEESLLEDSKHREFMRAYYSIPETGQRLFVIQPEVKWGSRKASLTTPELQLAEACALVDSLPDWKVMDKTVVRSNALNTKYMFGRGNLEELTGRIKLRNDLSAVFISVNMITGVQLAKLQEIWGLPVYDRYTVVLEIFKEHAKTKEAKLQVALAEIPYLRSRLQAIHDGTVSRSAGGMQHIGGSGETYLELRHRLLQARELKIKKALDKVKNQRKLLRANKARRQFPVVAVVGYTNAGKTSLIKALTGDRGMEPRDQLFATLDVTAHAGTLPSHMTVLYMDTVGFMSDIPTSLIDAFSATLEDALEADAVIHVRDISHPDTVAQRHHVLTTLHEMIPQELSDRLIEVCNKADLCSQQAEADSEGLFISAVTGSGLKDLVYRVEKTILENTGQSVRRLKVPMAGPHLSWLYKEATVKDSSPTSDGDHLVVQVVISEAAYAKFQAKFGQGRHRKQSV